MGNTIGFNYKKVKFDSEKMKVEARLYFQETNSSSKVFFRVIPQRERYRFKENEFIEVYTNDIFISRGRDETLKLYNSLCTDIPEIDFKTYPCFLIKHGKEIIYTVKVLISGEFSVFLGDIQTLFFVTNSIETLQKIIPDDSDYQYIVNRSEIFDNLHEGVERFSELV